jgi:hypothetical protein
MLSRLRARASQGKSLRHSVIIRRDRQLATALRKHFRSYGQALVAAGLAEKDWHWTRATIRKEMFRRLRKGLPVHRTSLREEERGLDEAIGRVYGSYQALHRQLGVKPLQQSWTREAIISDSQPVHASITKRIGAKACRQASGSERRMRSQARCRY